MSLDCKPIDKRMRGKEIAMNIIKYVLLGLVLVFLNQIIMLLFSLLLGAFSSGNETTEELVRMVTLNSAATALPMAALTFLLAWMLKIKSMAEAFRTGGIWALVLVIFYILIGLGNNTIEIILRSPAIYLMFLVTFAGPVLFGKLKRLE